MSEENWRPVVGFEWRYEVSDTGRVRSLDGKTISSHVGNKAGHLRVSLKPEIGEWKGRYIHQLVLEAFVGPRPKGLVACHNDGNSTNNRIENLRWDTPSSNMHDRVKHGTHQNANRTHCPKGHPLDAVKFHGDGTFWQRRCRTCLREQNRAKKARQMTCPQGHPFDGIAYWSDGSVRQRYCKRCRSESVSRQMTERNARLKIEQTHCKHGHPLDGLCKGRNGGPPRRYCKECLRQSGRRRTAAKKVSQS